MPVGARLRWHLRWHLRGQSLSKACARAAASEAVTSTARPQRPRSETNIVDLAKKSLQLPAAAEELLLLALWAAAGPWLVSQKHAHDVAAEGWIAAP